MTALDSSRLARRKAVWGPKRIVLATVVLLAFGLSANGIAKALGLNETVSFNNSTAEKNLAAFAKLASDQRLRMEKAWTAAIQRTLKKTNDAQVASLLDQLRLERQNAANVGAEPFSEGVPVQQVERPVARRNAPASGRFALTTQSSSGSPVTKARPGQPNFAARPHKLDLEIERRKVNNPSGSSSVIVELADGATLPAEFKRFARKSGGLHIINSQVLDLPNSVIRQLEARPEIAQVHHNRAISADNYRTAFTTGAKATQRGLGLTGAGVGVAIIDSGIATWHDDLTSQSASLYPYGNQRVAAFVDFVHGQVAPYDDQGHGTHVAGIVAGNGYDSNGRQMGVAPDASLVSLKVLDENGQGTVSNIIAALDWVLANQARYNIRVVNLSVGAIVTESYWTDPLTLAAKRVVDAGVVVVSAAGNHGRNAAGDIQYGAIAAPGNAPWVITVGASSTNGNTQREDDTIATFSSRGPTYLDWSAKPDLVAPGLGTISLASPLGTFYTSKAQYLQDGTVATANKPYLALSGTSMAAPVVSGTIAQMLQANPTLTPNAVKAILQYTAQEYPSYDPLTQGAGFLNAIGAVRLSAFYATAQPGQPVPVQAMWAKHLIWGNHLVSGGFVVPTSNAFALGTNWGVAVDYDGDNIVWGTGCGDGDCDNIVWGTGFDSDNIVWGTEFDSDNIVWGTGYDADNIVWGTDCGGYDCDNIVWGTVRADNIVWGTSRGENIVWGTSRGENIVWGTTDDDDNIVWGTADDDNIVWGTADDDNIVWGTNRADNIVWGTDGDDNIVWGTDDRDNIVWGTEIDGTIVWVNPNGGPVQQLQWSDMLQRLSDEEIFTILSSLSGGPRPIPPASDVPPPPVDLGPDAPPPPVDLGPNDAPPPPIDGGPPPPPPPVDSEDPLATNDLNAPPPPPPSVPAPGVGGGF